MHEAKLPGHAFECCIQPIVIILVSKTGHIYFPSL